MFETTTFLSVWYWLFLAFFWSLIVNWTFGVSKWALDRAKKSAEEKALAATLARRGIARAALAVTRPPLLTWTFQAFLVGAIATLAILRHSEVARGLLFIAAPMAAFNIWRVFEAQRLYAANLGDDELLARVARIRFLKQMLSAASISGAAAYGMWLHRGIITWHMSG